MKKSIQKRGTFKRVSTKLFVWSLVCVLCVGLYNPSTALATSNVVYLTSGSTWTVPDDWNSASNTIEVIGGGGSGMTSGSGGAGSSGGGGGAYSKITNAELIPGSTVTYSVGAGGSGNQVSGGDTWLCETTTSCTAITGGSVIVGAKAGTGGDPGLGGAAASGVGDTKYSGGNGGAAASNSSGGGGGAAGKNGNGANGGDGVTLLLGLGDGGHNKKIKILVAAFVLGHQIDEVLDVGCTHINHRIIHEGQCLLQLSKLLTTDGFVLRAVGIDALDGD